MAITLPNNLYSGEAERFNSMPHVQFQTQLLAKRKAKDEALDEYYKNLPTKINEKGVRDQERPIITQQVGKLQEHWMQNKDRIRNPKLDGGAAQLQHEQMFRDINNLVDQSKQRGKTGLELGKLKFQPNSGYIFRDHGIINKIQAHDLPIGAEGSEGIDLATMTLPAKPLESDYIKKNYSDIQFDEGTPTVQAHPTNKYYDVEVTPKILSKDKALAVYQRAATDFENNESFADTISTKLAKDPKQLEVLQNTFKETYGHPIQNDHDLAAAFVIQGMDKGDVKQKLMDNGLKAKEAQQRGFAHQELMRRIAKADAKDLISFRESIKGQDEENEWVERYVNAVADENKPQPTKGWLGNTKTDETKIFKPDQILYKALGEPAKTEITKDGNYKLTYIKKQKNEDGDDIEVVDASRTGIFTPEQVKLALGYKATTKKALAKEMNPNAPTQKATPSKSTSIKVKTSKPARVKQGDTYFILNDNGEYIPE